MKDFPTQKRKKKKYLKAKSKQNKAAIFPPFTKVEAAPVTSGIKKQEARSKVIKPKLPKLSLSRNHIVKAKRVLKRRESDLQLLLFPLILLLILITLHVINKQMFSTVAEEEFHASTVNTTLHPYPLLRQAVAPELSAKAAIIVDKDSQVILFSKSPDLRLSMASTTKIMTALTSMDYFSTDARLTIKSSSVEGSGLGLVRGDQFYFKDLLYAMLLPSANDAAQAIADNYPGGSAEFIKKMNEKAHSLHLPDTHFADPTGLNDDGDYTTVVDMARLASHAIENPSFVEVTSTKYKTISNNSFTRQYPLTNLNRLLGTDGVTGIKTGTTEGAGEVLVTSTTKNGHTYIIIVMYSQDRFSDTRLLMDFIDKSVEYVLPGFKNRE